ncbi:serine/threonine-protein kinase [Massilia luteola]|uniref:serine/threonine-protein kinase n=1 Tax=Massilia luteola TaxID=3081751 RepID=UPI002ACC2873|nr:serine/threonine-protein kinase [Massilia sp. Gc5]
MATIDKIGKYRIDGVLGSGAMGVVYKAFDADIARTVALKTIRHELLDGLQDGLQDSDIVARFRNEAQASGRLVHPNIVAVYDFGAYGDTTYIAMEYVDGTSLNAFLVKDVPMDLAASITCITQLLRALDYAHARGVVHRDIKPANILITGDAQVKITDFGIAKIESSTLTQVGAVIGTPSYMSPEQFKGETVDGRSDLFAVGIVLYQMLTGARPFSGPASTVMHQIIHEMPPRPSERQPSLHPAFDTVLAKAMAKRTEDRFPNALAFLDALSAAYMQQTGGVPLTDEDNERTVLAFQRPAVPEPARPAHPASTSQHGSMPAATGSASGLTGAAPPWLQGLAPELQTALSTQIGPVAKLVLKNAARDAVDLDDLCDKLLPHIGSDAGRAQFQDSIRDIKKKHGLSTLSTMSGRSQAGAVRTGTQLTQMTGMPTLLQLSPELMDAAQMKLAVYVGPIAKVLAKRASKITGNVDEFYRLLAENLPDPQERARFLKEVSKG